MHTVYFEIKCTICGAVVLIYDWSTQWY